MDQLESFCADLALPASPDADDIVFVPEMFTHIPSELESRDLHVTRGRHYYEHDYWVPQIIIVAPQESFRGLGLLAIAHAMFPDAETRVVVSPKKNTPPRQPAVTALKVGTTPNRSAVTHGLGLISSCVTAFRYAPDFDLPAFPGFDWRAGTAGLPTLNAAGPDGYHVREDQDITIHGFGTAEGSARLGGLLLDLSMDQSGKAGEYALEAELGCRGVANGSAELKFILPRSNLYEHIRTSQKC